MCLFIDIVDHAVDACDVFIPPVGFPVFARVAVRQWSASLFGFAVEVETMKGAAIIPQLHFKSNVDTVIQHTYEGENA